MVRVVRQWHRLPKEADAPSLEPKEAEEVDAPSLEIFKSALELCPVRGVLAHGKAVALDDLYKSLPTQAILR